ncbi:hypothetical protein [Geomonas propionica]|uniref:Uncharacterized protein n=1 Tax=Geomonas propionica TaxID=2798582 RepID=A0ABS0YVS1_9BACT|nr:hypothetical protein [Geomonas propionica]MBJ6802063.1 hypothetical protein [Geomonas propionica]
MEDDLNITLGGNWYVVEDGDDLRSIPISEGNTIDLLSEEWRWCDVVTKEKGYFMVFWATNNAGGPCLFIEDAPWVPQEIIEWLEELGSNCRD